MAAWLKFLLSSERARRISNMLIAFALLCFGFWFSCFVFPGLFFFSGNHNKVLGGQVNWYTDTRLKIYANTTTFPPKLPCPRVCVKPFEIFMKSILRRARQLSNLAGIGLIYVYMGASKCALAIISKYGYGYGFGLRRETFPALWPTSNG